MVGKRRLRRLHRTRGCGVSAVAVREVEAFRKLQYDLACRLCWRAGKAFVSEAEEADDSRSSESSEK